MVSYQSEDDLSQSEYSLSKTKLVTAGHESYSSEGCDFDYHKLSECLCPTKAIYSPLKAMDFLVQQFDCRKVSPPPW